MDLKKYLPIVTDDCLDMISICEAEEPELEMFSTEKQKIENDLIVSKARAQRIHELERLMNIEPSTLLDLNRRKKRIIKYQTTYGLNNFSNLIDEISDNSESHEIAYMLMHDIYYLEIICDVPPDIWGMLYKKILEQVPCNMLLVLRNNLVRKAEDNMSAYGAVSRIIHRRI